MKYLLLTISSIFVIANAHAEVRENGGRKAPLAIKMNFGSIGRGIDQELKKKIIALVNAHEAAGHVELISVKHYGLEGESSLCVQLKDFQLAYQLRSEISPMLIEANSSASLELALSCKENEKIDPRE